MAESDIIAAINSVRAHLESQFLATNQSIQECMIAFDNGFAALQGTRSSLPPPAGFPFSNHLPPQPPPSDPPPSYTDCGARIDEEKNKFHSGFRWAAKATPLNSVPPSQPHSSIQPTTLPKSFELGKALEKKYQDNNTRVQGWKFQDVWEETEPDVHRALTSRDPHNPSTIIGIKSDPLSMIEGSQKLVVVQPHHKSQIAHVSPQFVLSLSKEEELDQMQGKKLISKEATLVNLAYKMKEFYHWWGNVFLEVSRRLVIFSLYALEEVYKDL